MGCYIDPFVECILYRQFLVKYVGYHFVVASVFTTTNNVFSEEYRRTII